MIAIIAGCGTNISSVQFALERLGKSAVLTTDAAQIQAAERVILPGVGTAKHAMQQMQALNLVQVIRALTQPVFGICLGMQLLYATSEEGGADSVSCLGIVPNQIKALPQNPGLTVPHMGWNQLRFLQEHHPLLQGLSVKDYVYFVHSFAAPVDEYTVAATDYGTSFTAMMQKHNFYGAQFHPERSGKVGQKILENFLTLPLL